MNNNEDLKHELELKKRELDEAIHQAQAPVPSSDAQFDQLVEERERIMTELKELQKKYPKP